MSEKKIIIDIDIESSKGSKFSGIFPMGGKNNFLPASTN
jgi:hypothetical protein